MKLTLRQLANRARKWAESVAEEEDGWFDDDLTGLCARSAGVLWHLLKQNGIVAKIVYAHCHVFCLVGDMVVDVTATQFGNYPKVLIRPLDEMSEKGEQWSPISIVDTPGKVRRIQKRHEWPDEQII